MDVNQGRGDMYFRYSSIRSSIELRQLVRQTESMKLAPSNLNHKYNYFVIGASNLLIFCTN